MFCPIVKGQCRTDCVFMAFKHTDNGQYLACNIDEAARSIRDNLKYFKHLEPVIECATEEELKCADS